MITITWSKSLSEAFRKLIPITLINFYNKNFLLTEKKSASFYRNEASLTLDDKKIY